MKFMTASWGPLDKAEEWKKVFKTTLGFPEQPLYGANGPGGVQHGKSHGSTGQGGGYVHSAL